MNKCSKCDDSGWILGNKNGHEYARPCDCLIEDKYITLAEKANIPSRFIGAELKGYLPQDDYQTQKNAKNKISKFIQDFPAVSTGLMIQGPIGIGKTRLLCSIGYELLIKGIDVYYIDWNELVREMRTGEDHTSRDFGAINLLLQKLTSVELLLFDELGASKVSKYVYDNIYYLINKRYNRQKHLVCATNFFDEQKDDYTETLNQRIGERMRSRLFEMTSIIEISGQDLRRN